MPPPNPTTAPLGGGVWREDVALERIAALLKASPEGAAAAPWGDDAVVLDAATRSVAICTDAAVLGVHLDGDAFPVDDLGFRAAIAALSDLAAVGARPLGVLVAVCAPGDVDVVAIVSAAVEAAATVGCAVLGGDLSRASGAAVTATAIGTVGARAVTRSGARPGDAVVVTGPLGAAAGGRRRRDEGADLSDPLVLRFRRPAARVAAGEAAAASGATAMLDVSDGLARDLGRLAVASGVGIALEAVPLAEGATLADALGGGEDYELVCTHPDPEVLTAALVDSGLASPQRIGTVVDGAALTLGGAPLPDVGWRH